MPRYFALQGGIHSKIVMCSDGAQGEREVVRHGEQGDGRKGQSQNLRVLDGRRERTEEERWQSFEALLYVCMYIC